ncbi:MAG: hypothetical protein ACAI35_26465 [Candidatus Methylacidiphilales bacterium]|nr:hypothetical protein [Candidatus Methylacidiphilales bacterium]
MHALSNYAVAGDVEKAIKTSRPAPASGSQPHPLDSILQRPPANAYSVIWNRAPFTLPVAPTTEAPPPSVSWAAQYYLVFWNGEIDQVTIAEVTTRKRIDVRREPNSLGISLVSFEHNSDPTLSKAILRKNNEVGEVKFRGADTKPSPGMKSPSGPPTGLPAPTGTKPNLQETVPKPNLPPKPRDPSSAPPRPPQPPQPVSR